MFNNSSRSTSLFHPSSIPRCTLQYLFIFLCYLNILHSPHRKGNCKKVSLGLACEVGLRKRTFYILSGSVLGVWSKVESVLAGQSGANSKIQIIRCRISNGKKIVGKLGLSRIPVIVLIGMIHLLRTYDIRIVER